ncbi:MAG: hypothetical protein ACYC97_10135, partial [Metallibacterium sp.]
PALQFDQLDLHCLQRVLVILALDGLWHGEFPAEDTPRMLPAIMAMSASKHPHATSSQSTAPVFRRLDLLTLERASLLQDHSLRTRPF